MHHQKQVASILFPQVFPVFPHLGLAKIATSDFVSQIEDIEDRQLRLVRMGSGMGWIKKMQQTFFCGSVKGWYRCCCCSCSCCSCCCCFRDSSLWKHCCVLEEMKEHQQSGKRRARPLKGCNYSALLKVQWITLKSPFNSESITQPAKKKNHIIIFGYYLINTRFHTQVMTLLNQDPMRAAGLNLCEFACGMSETSEILPTPRPKVATSRLKIWACLKSKDLV